MVERAGGPQPPGVAGFAPRAVVTGRAVVPARGALGGAVMSGKHNLQGLCWRSSRPERPKRALGARPARRRNRLGLHFAESERTPVTEGCSAPSNDGSSPPQPPAVAARRRPPAVKRSQSRRRQPAPMPPIRTALGAKRPPTAKRSPFRRRQPVQSLRRPSQRTLPALASEGVLRPVIALERLRRAVVRRLRSRGAGRRRLVRRGR